MIQFHIRVVCVPSHRTQGVAIFICIASERKALGFGKAQTRPTFRKIASESFKATRVNIDSEPCATRDNFVLRNEVEFFLEGHSSASRSRDLHDP